MVQNNFGPIEGQGINLLQRFPHPVFYPSWLLFTTTVANLFALCIFFLFDLTGQLESKNFSTQNLSHILTVEIMKLSVRVLYTYHTVEP